MSLCVYPPPPPPSPTVPSLRLFRPFIGNFYCAPVGSSTPDDDDDVRAGTGTGAEPRPGTRTVSGSGTDTDSDPGVRASVQRRQFACWLQKARALLND